MRHLNKHLAAVFAAAVACWLSLGASAVEITPPNPVPLYRLVRVQYEQADNSVVLVFGFRDGRVITPDMVDGQDGSLYFTGPPGSYVVGGLEAGRRFQQTVVVGGDAPGPDPGPGPGPGPDPEPVPDGFQGLTKLSYGIVRAMPASARQHCAKIAENYHICARNIEAGWAAKDQLRKLEQANVRLVGPEASDWIDFGRKTDKRLNELIKDTQIGDSFDLAKALHAVANGIAAGGQ